MRTFIAIELSPEIKQGLAGIQAELKKSDADVKWVDPENIHLTLKFLGEISDTQLAEQVKGVINKIAARFKPFELSIAGIGAFPKLDYPRVVWVGIEKGKEETKKIAHSLDEELSKLGFAREDREFAAHLTIGRVRSSKNKQTLKEIITNYALQCTNYEQVNSLNFYQSTLTPRGPIYTCLLSAKLI